MKSATQARTSRPRATAPFIARRGPHLNALKHGLRSGSVLLPGDDVAAFRTLRQRLFHLYQPRTVEEAQCVETVAASHWRIARCRVEQAVFKAHLGAVMSGDPAATGYVCDPDPHALHHRSMDCVLEEARLEKFKFRAQATLALLQKQRTQSLSAMNPGALEDYRVFLAEGEPVFVPRSAPGDPTRRRRESSSTSNRCMPQPRLTRPGPTLGLGIPTPGTPSVALRLLRDRATTPGWSAESTNPSASHERSARPAAVRLLRQPGAADAAVPLLPKS